MRFWNSECGFGIRSEVLEFGVRFRIGSVVWNSECTCGPPHVSPEPPFPRAKAPPAKRDGRLWGREWREA